jgi:hypothetical protein
VRLRVLSPKEDHSRKGKVLRSFSKVTFDLAGE